MFMGLRRSACKMSGIPQFPGQVITPRAHVRIRVQQSVLSVSRLSVCQSVRQEKLKSRHIDPHKPSKGSQTIANSKKKPALCVPD